MALNARVVVAVLMVAVVAAVGVVRAQTTNCASAVYAGLAVSCEMYIDTPSMVTPDVYCCNELRYVQELYGLDCYCDVILAYRNDASPGENATKVYGLPESCNVAADMSQCPTPAPSTSGTVVAPTSGTVASPPSAPLLSPPGLLISSPPAAPFLTPPLPPSSPGSSTPTTVPTSLLPTPGSKSSSSSSSLAVPIGASAGGAGVVILCLVYVILRYACKIDLKWNLNDPCFCCGPRHPHHPPDDKANGVVMPEIRTNFATPLRVPYRV